MSTSWAGASRQRGGSTVDLRAQIVSVKVASALLLRADPVLRELRGLGPSAGDRERRGTCLPGLPGRLAGARSGGEESCSFPALRRARGGLRRGGATRRGSLRRDDPAGALRLRRRHRAAGGPAVLGARADQVAGRRRRGPPRSSRTSTGSRAPASRSAGCCVDNPWESCNGELTFDPTRFPDPARMIEQVHARGVKVMLWVSPRETCSQGYAQTSILGPPGHQILDLRKPGAVARVPGTAQAPHRARDRRDSRATGATRTTSSRSRPRSTTPTPPLCESGGRACCPKDGAAIFRAATVGSQSVLPGIWAGDQAETWAGLQGAIVDRADGRDERVPDLGIGYRWLPRGLALSAAALRAVGAARCDLARDGGRRRRSERDPVDARDTGRWTSSGRRRCSTTSSSPTSTGCCSSMQPVLRPLAYSSPHDAAFLGLPARAARRARPAGRARSRPRRDAERVSPARLLGRSLLRESRPGRRSGLHAPDADDRVPAVREARCRRAVRPPDRDGLLVGRERAHPPGPGRLPDDQRRDARPERASRATSRSSSRPPRGRTG